MLIGIGGASRSGKTRLANGLESLLGTNKCDIIHQDNYTLPKDLIPKIKDEVDWESPQGIDFNKLKSDIIKSAQNNHYTIAEGFLIFYDQEIKKLFDLSIYLSIDKKTFKSNKIQDHRWGKVPDFYVEHIWQSHLERGTVDRNEVDFYFDNTSCEFEDILLLLSQHLPKGK